MLMRECMRGEVWEGRLHLIALREPTPPSTLIEFTVVTLRGGPETQTGLLAQLSLVSAL